jgi:hypothetical protein
MSVNVMGYFALVLLHIYTLFEEGKIMFGKILIAHVWSQSCVEGECGGLVGSKIEACVFGQKRCTFYMHDGLQTWEK